MTARPPLDDRPLLVTETARRALEVELRELRAAGRDGDDAAAARAAELERALLRAVLVRPDALDAPLAAVGTTVRADDGRRFVDLTLTVGEEGRPTDDAGAVCARSPVGRALLGRTVGEIVPVVDADGRARHLRILRIREAL
ncbi:hypothetical protein ACVU7I_14555 [Patulibacter sp. S7RM1-6]